MAAQNFSASVDQTSLFSSVDYLIEPQVFNKLGLQFPKQRENFVPLMMSMGRIVKAHNNTIRSKEENRIRQKIYISAKSTDNGADTTIDASGVRITVGSENITTINSLYYSNFQAGDTIEFANGTQGIVHAVSQPTGSATHYMYVKPSISSEDVQTATVVGDYCTIETSGLGEGTSGNSTQLEPNFTTITNWHQLIYKKYEVTGTSQNTDSYITFTFPEGHPNAGQTGRGLYVKGEGDTAMNFLLDIANALVKQKSDGTSTTITVNGASESVVHTRGLIPSVKTYGTQMTYVNTPTLSTIEELNAIHRSNYGDDNHCLLSGGKFMEGIGRFIHDLGDGGSIIYSASDDGSVDRIELGAKQFSHGGFTYMPYNLDLLDFADTSGAAGKEFPYSFISCPLGQSMDKDNYKRMNKFQISYLEAIGKGARSWYKVWQTGGNSPDGTNNSLKRRINFATEGIALQILGHKEFVYGTKQ